MKKFLMAIGVLAVATIVASAGVGISWTAGTWGYANDGASAILDNNSALWQLIYAGADGVLDLPDSLNVAGGYVGTAAVPANQDVVWASRTVAMTGGTAPEDSTVWDNWLTYQSGSVVYTDMAWATAGSVYQRVFEAITPVGGTWYFDSEPTALITTYDPSAPATATVSFADQTGNGFVTDAQVPTPIPEPATMGLLGLGALVMAIRRRRS